MTGKIIERQGFRPRTATRSLRPRDYSKRPRFTMLRAGNTEPSADPPIPASGSRTTCFRRRWGRRQISLILTAPIALQPTRFPRHKTLMPVSSRPTCLPSTCAGSRSERNTNFKWDSAGLSGISGIPCGERSCTLEGSCALGTSSHARRIAREHLRTPEGARLGHVRALEGSCRREMVSCAHPDDAPPARIPRMWPARSRPASRGYARSNRIGHVPGEKNGYARGRMIGA